MSFFAAISVAWLPPGKAGDGKVKLAFLTSLRFRLCALLCNL